MGTTARRPRKGAVRSRAGRIFSSHRVRVHRTCRPQQVPRPGFSLARSGQQAVAAGRPAAVVLILHDEEADCFGAGLLLVPCGAAASYIGPRNIIGILRYDTRREESLNRRRRPDVEP